MRQCNDIQMKSNISLIASLSSSPSTMSSLFFLCSSRGRSFLAMEVDEGDEEEEEGEERGEEEGEREDDDDDDDDAEGDEEDCAVDVALGTAKEFCS